MTSALLITLEIYAVAIPLVIFMTQRIDAQLKPGTKLNKANLIGMLSLAPAFAILLGLILLALRIEKREKQSSQVDEYFLQDLEPPSPTIVIKHKRNNYTPEEVMQKLLK